MQESIKEVINIHKCKFLFYFILCGLAGWPAQAAGLCGPSPRGPTILARPAFFLRAGPAGQTLIAIPNYDLTCEQFF